MTAEFLNLTQANQLLCDFRKQFMTHSDGAEDGLVEGFTKCQISVGIVEDHINNKKYRKSLKLWLNGKASLAIVKRATQLEVAQLSSTPNHVVCYDDTITVDEKTKKLRCILNMSKTKEGVFELYVDTAFFDDGINW